MINTRSSWTEGTFQRNLLKTEGIIFLGIHLLLAAIAAFGWAFARKTMSWWNSSVDNVANVTNVIERKMVRCVADNPLPIAPNRIKRWAKSTGWWTRLQASEFWLTFKIGLSLRSSWLLGFVICIGYNFRNKLALEWLGFFISIDMAGVTASHRRSLVSLSLVDHFKIRNHWIWSRFSQPHLYYCQVVPFWSPTTSCCFTTPHPLQDSNQILWISQKLTVRLQKRSMPNHSC